MPSYLQSPQPHDLTTEIGERIVTMATVKVKYSIQPGAPEVRGTTCYIIPETVEWSITTHNGTTCYVAAWVDGRPSRGGRPRGRGTWCVPLDVPDWCPRPTDEWIAAAHQLIKTANQQVSGNGGDR